MVSTLERVFSHAKGSNRAVLVGYLPVGYPTVPDSVKAILALVGTPDRPGAQVVELGIAYSDPVMDGPIIQQATDAVRAQGVTTAQVLEVVGEVNRRLAEVGWGKDGSPSPAIMIMSYWNLIEHYGVVKFAAELAAAGGAGVITPDLIPEEADEWLAASDAAGLDRVFLVAPSSSSHRLAATVAACRGFVYAASTMGVTGERTSVSAAAQQLVARTREVTTLPICVGLGVSTPEQAREVAKYADGVIVGSALVRTLAEAESAAAGVTKLRDQAVSLAEALHKN